MAKWRDDPYKDPYVEDSYTEDEYAEPEHYEEPYQQAYVDEYHELYEPYEPFYDDSEYDPYGEELYVETSYAETQESYAYVEQAFHHSPSYAPHPSDELSTHELATNELAVDELSTNELSAGGGFEAGAPAPFVAEEPALPPEFVDGFMEAFRPKPPDRKPKNRGRPMAPPSARQVIEGEYADIPPAEEGQGMTAVENQLKNACWVRVSQLMAGNGWGAAFVPRVGQEVIISFLNGDPDQPIITGTVYNRENMPPFYGGGAQIDFEGDDVPVPADLNPFVSGFQSVSQGGNGANIIRFADNEGAEEFFLEAQKDMFINVKDYMCTTVGGDHELTVTGKDFYTVEQDQMVSIMGNRETFVEGGEATTVAYDNCLTIDGCYCKTIEKCDDTFIANGNKTLTIDAGDRDVTLNAGHGMAMDMYFLEKGMKDTTVSMGTLSTTILTGMIEENIMLGSHSFSINKGKQEIDVKGRRMVEVTGQAVYNFIGPYKFSAKGPVTQDILGNSTTNITGAAKITVKGPVNLKVVGPVNVTSTMDITMKAAKTLNLQAGVNINLKAGKNVVAQGGVGATLKGGANVNIQAGAKLGLKAAMLNAQASGMLGLKASGIGKFEAGGIAMVKGAMVKIN